MSTPIKSLRPYGIRRVAVSGGGASQVTIITFPDAQSGEVITLAAESALFILQDDSPDEGDAYDDTKAFPVPTGGYAEFPVSGWANAMPRIKLSSPTVGAIVRVMIAKSV